MDEIINLSTTLSVILQLGRVGENNANEITFDFSNWQSEFGEGTVSLVCKRPTDAEGYPVSLTVSGTEATWLVSSTDVAYEGLGQAQISYTVNGVIKKSVIYMTRTCPSIEPVSSTPPDPYASWLDQMIEAKEDAEAARDEAVEVAGDLTEMAKTFPALLVTGSSSGSIATFDDGSETPVKSLSINIDPVQAGSGDPSPENVRPISGWDGVNVTVCGKNLRGGISMAQDVVALVNNERYCNIGSDADGQFLRWTQNDAVNKGIIFNKFKENTQYTLISKFKQSATNISTDIQFDYTDGTFTRISSQATEANVAHTLVATSNAGKTVADIRINNFHSGTRYIYYEDFGIFEGVLTADDFVPYEGNSYPISLPQTVYGGVLDVGKGELTVTKKMAQITSTSAIYYESTAGGRFRVAGLLTGKIETSGYDTDLLCSYYKADPSPTQSGAVDNTICGWRATDVSYIIDRRFETAEAYKAWLADNPVAVVYNLATPLTLSLTPTEVRTILGYNNIYADSGNVDVVYYRDLDIVINRLLEGSASL